LLIKNLISQNFSFDVPTPWGIYFQDSATPQMEGLVELHDNIMYYLVIILFAVAWVMLSIVRNYIETKSPFSHKYWNHGKCVPFQKCFKLRSLNNVNYIRTYSTNSSNINNVILYEDAFSMKKQIIKDNKDKSRNL